MREGEVRLVFGDDGGAFMLLGVRCGLGNGGGGGGKDV